MSATGCPATSILAELDRIVTSAAFGKAERPARFLRHLVETALRGEPHLLRESLLGVEVFGRPASWDPRIDPVVRQEAARLRKRLARFYEQEGAASGVRIEIPVGGYVPAFHLLQEASERPAVVAHSPYCWRWAAVGAVLSVCAFSVWLLLPRRSGG